jgi:integrase
MGVAVREKQKNSGVYWLFIRHAGERVSQMVGDKDTAEDAAKEIRREIRTGRFDIAAIKAARAAEVPKEEKPSLPTLREYYARFSKECLRLTVGESTQDVYDNAFHNHLLCALVPENPDSTDSTVKQFGEFRLNEITRPHLKALVASLVEKKCSRVVNVKEKDANGNEITVKKAVEFNLAKPSLRIFLSALTTCLTNAQREDGLIPNNPALALGRFIKQTKPRHESIDPLTPEEVPTFLDAVRQVAADYLCMMIVLIHTGLRSGECAGLLWSDIDFRNRYVLVRRTLTRRGLKPPKNGKERKVDLSDASIAALKTHRAKLLADYLKSQETDETGTKKPMPEWVFPNGEGNPHNMTNVRNRIFYRALQKAGLHRRPLHATRHTFATLMLNQGESPVYVKDQCGHSSIKITVDVYGKWIRTPDRRAVNLLPSLPSMTSAVSAD